MPFAGYKDFDECVRKNSDKSDPKAYCGTIKHAVESWDDDMNPKLQQFHVHEQVGTIEAFEDTEENGMRARIRIIKAGLSKNNRNYRVTALKEAAKEGVFNDLKMFVGHSKDLPLKRDMDKFVSYTDGVEFVPATESLEGWANFVDRPFFEKARAAKKHIGVSIDSLLSGTRHPQPGGRALEDIHGFAQPRSVDWVLFPAAGGEILAFESEGDEVDWAAVEAEAGTLSEEDLKKNLPSLWAKWHPDTGAHKLPVNGHNAQEGEEDDEGDEEPPKKKLKKTEFVAKEEVDEIVSQRMIAYQKERDETERKIASAAAQVKAAFESSGLPERTRNRVMAGFEGVEEFKEEEVKKAITDAKEELKAAGAGPRITGMGPGGTSKDEQKQQTFSAHESVAAAFGKKPEAAKTGDDPDEKEKGK
jgi:hypothetical protein